MSFDSDWEVLLCGHLDNLVLVLYFSYAQTKSVLFPMHEKMKLT